MSSVDNRVVKMTFDNAQFEKRIKETAKSLSDFEKSLKLDGATAGFDALKKSTDKLDLTALGKKAEKESKKVSDSTKDAAKSIKGIDDAANKVDMTSIGKSAEKEAGKVGNAADEALKSINGIDDGVDDLDFKNLGDSVAKEGSRINDISGEAVKSIDSIDAAADDADFSSLSKAASTAVDDVNRSAGMIDLTPIVNETTEAAQGFSVMEEIAVGALRQIGAGGVDFIMEKLQALGNGIKEWMIDPIKDGFKEYETQMGAIQTIIANTGMSFDSDADIAEVNQTLDVLNKYADDTIYNFTEMTKAIGTFTSSGLGLEEAKDAVQGAANVAALAGADTSALTRVLPQLSQALSAGTVSQQDWMSVQTAQMDSLLFRKTIGDVAVHMAEAGKAEETAFIAGQQLLEGANMRQLLNKVDNKDIAGWFSSDILAETLQMFTYDLDNMTADARAKTIEHLKELGYESEEEIQAIQERAEMAKRAATEVRTFSQLTDTLKEAIGSSWSSVWRNFVGDFKQATDTFTFLSNTLSDGVDGLLGGLVHSMQIFNRFEDKEGVFGKKGGIYSLADALWGGYDRYTEEDFANGLIDDEALIGSKKADANGELVRIKGALDYIVEAITTPLNAIGDAFDSVFGMSDAQIFDTLGNFVLAFKDFAQGLILSDDAAQGLYNIAKGLFSIIDIGLHVVLDAGAAFFGLAGILRSVIDPLIDIALALGGQLGKVIEWVHDKLLEVREAIIESAQPLFDLINVVTNTIRAFFGFADIPYAIDGVGDILIGLLDILWRFIDIPGKIKAIGDVLSNIFGFIGEVTGWNAAVAETNKIFAETGERVNTVSVFFDRLSRNPIGAFFKTLVDILRGAVDSIFNFFNAMKNGSTETKKATTNVTALTVVFDILRSILGFVGTAFSIVGTILISVVGIIAKVAGAIGDLAGKAVTALAAWEPIQELGSKLSEFKDGAIKFFLSLPGRIDEMSSKLSGSVGSIKDIFGKATDWILGRINAIKKIDFSKTLSNITNTFRTFSSGFENGHGENVVYGAGIGLVRKFDKMSMGMLISLNKLAKAIPFVDDSISSKIYANVIKPMRATLFGLSTWLSEIASKSKSLPDFMLNVLTSIKDIVVSKINDIRNYISSLSLSDILDGIRTKLQQTVSTIMDIFPKAEPVIQSGLNQINEFITKYKLKEIDWKTVFTKDIPNAVSDFTSKVRGAVIEIANKLKEAWPAISDWVSEKIAKIPEIASTVVEIAKDWGSRIAVALKSGFTTAKDIASDLGKKISDSFSDMTEKVQESDTVFGSISRTMPDKLQALKDGMGVQIDGIKENLFDLYKKIALKDDGTLKTSGDYLLDIITFLKDRIGALIKFFTEYPQKLQEAFNKFKAFFTLENLRPILEFAKSIAGIRALWSGSKMFAAIGGFAGAGEKLLKSLNKAIKAQKNNEILDRVISMFKNFAILVGTIGATIYVISRIENPQKAIDTMWQCVGMVGVLSFIGGMLDKFGGKAADHLVKVASTIGIFGISMLIAMKTITQLTAFDWAGNIPGLVAMGGALLVLAGITALVGRFGGDGGKQAIKIAIGIGIMSLAIQALIDPIQRLTSFITELKEEDIGKLAGSVVVIGLLVAELGAIMNFAGDNKHLIAAGVGFAIMAGSVGLLTGAIAELAAVDVVGGIVALAGITAILHQFSKIIELANEGGAIKAAAAVLAFAGAISVISGSLSTLAGNDLGGTIAAGASVAVLLGELIYMVKKLDAKDLLKTSGALLVFSLSVAAISASLYFFSKNDPVPMLATAGAVAGLILAFTALARLTNGVDLVSTAGSLAIFSLALAGMVGSLYLMQSLDWKMLLISTGVLSGLILAFGLLATATNGIDLIATAGAFSLFAAAIGVLALALEVATGAIIKLAAATPILLMFATTVSEHFLEFGAAAIGATLLAVGLGALGLALVAFGTGATIGAGGIGLLASAMDVLIGMSDKASQMFEAFHSVGFNITAGIGQGIVAGIGTVMTSVGVLVKSILGSILGSFGIHSPSTVMADEVGQYIPAGIGVGMMENMDSIDINGMLDSVTEGIDVNGMIGNLTEGIDLNGMLTDVTEGIDLNGILGNLTEGVDLGGLFGGMTESLDIPGMLSGLLDGVGSWIQTDGLPRLGEALQTFWAWFTTDGLPMLGNACMEILHKLGELAVMFWNWFTTEGIPMIQKAASDFWNWFTTQGLPMLGNFIVGILGKLGELASGVGQWIVDEGLPMLGKAAGDFLNWAKTDGLPALGTFVGDIFKALGELLKNLGKWVVEEGLPAIGQWLLDILGKLGELPGQLVEWAKGLPDNIKQGLGDIADWAGNIGGDIINGIVKGITEAPKAIADAVVGMASGGLEQIKKFFGINSPSRVMKEEVGRYIPEGLAEGIKKYAFTARKQSEKLGEATTDGLNSGLSGINNRRTFDVNVVPVIDGGDFMSSLDSISARFNGVLDGVHAQMNVAQTIDANLDSSSLLNAFMGQTDSVLGRMNQWQTSQMASEAEQVGRLEDSLNRLYDKIDKMGIYLDSGALVGGIASQVDRQLGMRQAYAARGIY